MEANQSLEGASKMDREFIPLHDVTDITAQVLASERHLLFGQMFTVHPEEVYKAVHGKTPQDQLVTKSVALRPQTAGTRNSHPNSLFGPGLIASHPDATTDGYRRFDSRSALLPDQTLVKGVGTRTVVPEDRANDPKLGFLGKNDHPGWEIIGGVQQAKAEQELLNSIYLAYLYGSLYPGDDVPVRIASNVIDVSAALESQSNDRTKILPVHQVYFRDLKHPTRNINAKYLGTPDFLFSNINLDTEEGKQSAVDLWNQLQSDWLVDYQENHPNDSSIIKPLDFDDFMQITDPNGDNMFQLLKKQEKFLVDSKNSTPIRSLIDSATAGFSIPIPQLRRGAEKKSISIPQLTKYTKEDGIVHQGVEFYIQHLAETIAHKFMSNNEELVMKTLSWNTERMGKIIGMNYALGWDLGSAASSKDMYGGRVADLDVLVQYPEDPFDPKHISDGYRDTIFYAQNSLRDMALMYGLTSKTNPEELTSLEKIFYEQVRNGYRTTLDNVSQLPISDEYRSALADYHQKLISHTDRVDPWNYNTVVKQLLATSSPTYYEGLDPVAYKEHIKRMEEVNFPTIFRVDDLPVYDP